MLLQLHLRVPALAVVVMLVLIATTIGCDSMTKHAALTYLEGRPGHSFLGGTLRLESSQRGRTTFVVTLPAEPVINRSSSC